MQITHLRIGVRAHIREKIPGAVRDSFSTWLSVITSLLVLQDDADDDYDDDAAAAVRIFDWHTTMTFIISLLLPFSNWRSIIIATFSFAIKRWLVPHYAPIVCSSHDGDRSPVWICHCYRLCGEAIQIDGDHDCGNKLIIAISINKTYLSACAVYLIGANHLCRVCVCKISDLAIIIYYQYRRWCGLCVRVWLDVQSLSSPLRLMNFLHICPAYASLWPLVSGGGLNRGQTDPVRGCCCLPRHSVLERLDWQSILTPMNGIH